MPTPKELTTLKKDEALPSKPPPKKIEPYQLIPNPKPHNPLQEIQGHLLPTLKTGEAMPTPIVLDNCKQEKPLTNNLKKTKNLQAAPLELIVLPTPKSRLAKQTQITLPTPTRIRDATNTTTNHQNTHLPTPAKNNIPATTTAATPTTPMPTQKFPKESNAKPTTPRRKFVAARRVFEKPTSISDTKKPNHDKIQVQNLHDKHQRQAEHQAESHHRASLNPVPSPETYILSNKINGTPSKKPKLENVPKLIEKWGGGANIPPEKEKGKLSKNWMPASKT